MLISVLSPIAANSQQQAEQAVALCDSGMTFLEQGDTESAHDLLNQALRLAPGSPRVLIGMGRVLLAIPRRAGRALEHLTQAVNLDPTNSVARYYKALAHIELAARVLDVGNAEFALHELQALVALDPSHPDAWFQLGCLDRDHFQDPAEACMAFQMQIDANPAHREARTGLLRTLTEMGKWQQAIEVGVDLLGRDPPLEAYLYCAGSYWQLDNQKDARGVFERYFAVAPEQERALYFDLSFILTPEEIHDYINLPMSGKTEYWNHYWSIRDPLPQTMENERLIEHFIRIAWARLEFGRTVWPWDARGSFYVRYGEPDHRSGRGRPVASRELIDSDPLLFSRKRDFEESMSVSSKLTGMGLLDVYDGAERVLMEAVIDSLMKLNLDLDMQEIIREAELIIEGQLLTAASSPAPERWVYLDRGIDINFDDPVGRGEYLISGDRSRMLVERMEERLPSLSDSEDAIEHIDPMDTVVTFRGSNGGTVVEYAFALLPDEFGPFRSQMGAYATINVDVRLFSPEWTQLTETNIRRRRLETVSQVTIRGIPLFVDSTRLEVLPGTCWLTTFLLDPISGKRATAEEEIALPDYSGSALMLSDILPAALIRQVESESVSRFRRGDLEVLPLPGRALQIDQPLFIYYEIYNLKKDDVGGTDYEITYSVAEMPNESGIGSRLYQGEVAPVRARQRRIVLSSSFHRSGIQTDISEYLELGMEEVPPGTYLLELVVHDANSGTETSKHLLFRTLPKLGYH
ncbi:tetratricopeptide repeat protein [Gemmatimonadota bacterium]